MTLRWSARGLVSSISLPVVLAACTSSPPDLPPTAPVSVVPAPAPTPEPEHDPEPAPGETPDLTVPVALTRVADMRTPIAAAVGPDGTFYVAEREGTVRPLTAAGPGSPVLDISAETTTDGERGLLGLAFAPDGSELYVSFTDTDGDTVIDAVAVEDGVVVADRRRTVFTYPQPFQNHNGGDLQIGPDGLLYIGLGDGGGGGDPVGAGQDVSTPLGALLRIDPVAAEPYGVPEDNPFVGDLEAAAEIWAYGLRNPWRFSFDRLTGDLWIADVGQDSREEINWMPAGEGAGANYGWNLMEGTREFAGAEPAGHVPPVHEYETTRQRCSITGGYVYRGDAIPELSGAYLFSDYCEGALRALVVSEDGTVVDEADLGVGGDAVVSFAQDAAGELYLLDAAGPVWRIDPA
jgi:glucose/arabinose dehydrogenase